jgi:hypothetical protein
MLSKASTPAQSRKVWAKSTLVMISSQVLPAAISFG